MVPADHTMRKVASEGVIFSNCRSFLRKNCPTWQQNEPHPGHLTFGRRQKLFEVQKASGGGFFIDVQTYCFLQLFNKYNYKLSIYITVKMWQMTLTVVQLKLG